jgi:hypothetical protein
MENNHPLILVFYLDAEMMRNPQIIQPFAESVNYMIEQKNANMMAFFLPTTGEERVECINPVMLSEPDMVKVEQMIKDIQEQFSVGVDIEVQDEEIEVGNKPCECGGNCKCDEQLTFEWDYKILQPVELQSDWNQTLITAINQMAAKIRKKLPTGSGAKKIQINKTLLPLFETLAYFTNDNDNYSIGGRFSVTLDNSLPDNQINILTDNEDENIIGKIYILNYKQNE